MRILTSLSLFVLLSSTIVWAGEGSKTSGPILIETRWLSEPQAGKTAELKVSAQIHDEKSDQLKLAVRGSKGITIKSKKSKTFSEPIEIHDVKTHLFKFKFARSFKKGRVVVDAIRTIGKNQESVSTPVPVLLP